MKCRNRFNSVELVKMLATALIANIQNALYTTLFFVGLSMFIAYHWRRRKFYALSWKCEGPLGYPLVGNALQYAGSTKDMVRNMHRLLNYYPQMSRFWMGPIFVMKVDKPEDMQIVLNSPKCLKKSMFYEKITPVQGYGIFTAPVEMWKRHRRLINPTFNSLSMLTFIQVFNEQASILIKELRKYAGTGEFNIFEKMGNLTIDVIYETALGIKLQAQVKETRRLHVMQRLMHIALMRAINAWYYFDFMFKLFPISKEFDALLKEMDDHIYQVIRNRRAVLQERQQNEKSGKDGQPDEDDFKNKRFFLDYLLELQTQYDDFDDKQIRDEIVAFAFGGSDTTATTNCFILLMLAMHPQIQEDVYAELVDVFGDSDRFVTTDDLVKLELLERVIKETLRVFPVAFGIGREVTEDIQLSEYTVPAGCNIFIGAMNLHRNSKYWPEPYRFDPDRFLPEEVAKRHPYCYQAFSQGARNCIGTRFAMTSMKVELSHILRHYKFTTHKYKRIQDIEFDWQIVISPLKGFGLEMELRNPDKPIPA